MRLSIQGRDDAGIVGVAAAIVMLVVVMMTVMVTVMMGHALWRWDAGDG